MAYLVRETVLADVSELGAVHVRAWQTAYRGGLMPDEYLNSLSADDRADTWRRGLEADPRPRHHRYVVDDGTGTPVGFIVVGPADGEPEAQQGEVYSVNVDPDHWGKGAGTLLLEQGVTALTEDGFPTAMLWVHPAGSSALMRARFPSGGGMICAWTLRLRVGALFGGVVGMVPECVSRVWLRWLYP